MFKEQNIVEPTIIGVFIQPNSSLCGLLSADIQLPEKCILLGILREGKVISATDNPTINAGDYILAIAVHPMMTPALKVTLRKIHPAYYSLNACLLETQPILGKASHF